MEEDATHCIYSTKHVSQASAIVCSSYIETIQEAALPIISL